MDNFYTVDILTPYKALAKNIPAHSLLIPTQKGQINILPEHTHIISKLDTGTLSVFGASNDPDRHFSITSGICKVLNNKITILSNVSEEIHEIDVERAERALKNAQETLKHTDGMSDDEVEKYRRKVERAKLRIQIAKEYSK